jgi:hypothetical protein
MLIEKKEKQIIIHQYHYKILYLKYPINANARHGDVPGHAVLKPLFARG